MVGRLWLLRGEMSGLLVVLFAELVLLVQSREGSLRSLVNSTSRGQHYNHSSWLSPEGQPAFHHPKPDDVQVGCKELRSKRYISDGFCTSVKPISEVVCAGYCLPIRYLPWYAEYVKVTQHKKFRSHRCVEDVVKRRNIELKCDNGSSQIYKIKIVKSCKCKQYDEEENMVSNANRGDKEESGKRRKNKKRKQKTRRRHKSRTESHNTDETEDSP